MQRVWDHRSSARAATLAACFTRVTLTNVELPVARHAARGGRQQRRCCTSPSLNKRQQQQHLHQRQRQRISTCTRIQSSPLHGTSATAISRTTVALTAARSFSTAVSGNAARRQTILSNSISSLSSYRDALTAEGHNCKGIGSNTINSASISTASPRPSSSFSSSSWTSDVRNGRDPVKCGVVSPMRTVPDHVPKTPYYAAGAVPPADPRINLHTKRTLVPMRAACVLARDMLDLCCAMAKPGVTTDDIDAAVHDAIVKAGACPSPLNYHGFPKSVCSSVNEIACHAIPDDRPLQDGDLVSFDVSVFLAGFHGDNCATVGVGSIDEASQRLMDACKEGMMKGVSVCRPGACMTEIGSAIHDVADRYGYDTVRKFCGHGVGSGFHMLPFVEHFRNDHRLEMVPGMTFTIEPIFTEGSEATTIWSDGWTVQTKDGGRAAQFEHVVLITDGGHEILTVPSSSTTQEA